MSRTFVVLALAASVCFGQTDPFQSHVNIPAGDGTGSLALADFNGDGKTDIAVMNPLANTITVLLEDGKGGFAPAPGGALHFTSARAGSEPLAAGDFNGDGNADLVFTEHTSPFFLGVTRLVVRFGKGDGTFLAAPTGSTVLSASYFFDRLEAVDWNQDGKLDVVGNVPTNVPRGSTAARTFGGRLYLGDGLGAFGPTEARGGTAFGDFNQDGQFDYVTGRPSTATVHLAEGSGTYRSVETGGLTGGISQIEVVDYDRDGALDVFISTIAVPSINNPSASNTDTVFGLRGVGTGDLMQEFKFTAGRIALLRAGDFNGDGVTDVAVAQDNVVRVALLRKPTVTLGPLFFDYGTGLNIADMRAADFDGDGKTDLAVSNGGELLLFFTGSEGGAPQTITFPAIPDRSVNSEAFAPPVSASSGLPVTITSNAPSVCTVSANTISLVAGGTCSLQASQPGDASTKAAVPVYRSFNVSFVPQRITVAPIGPVPYGSTVRVQAAASSGLPLTFSGFYSDVVCFTDGPLLTVLRVGVCQLTISQAGDRIYASTSMTVNVEIVGAASQPEHTITFPPLPDAPLSQSSISIPSPISTSGYVATLTSNTPEICGVNSGYPYRFVQTLNAGICSLTASLDPQYPPAPPVTRTFTVLPIERTPQTINVAMPQTIFSLASFSLPVSFSTTSSLSVTVVSSTPTICLAQSAFLIRVVAVGTCSLTATHPGNAFFLPATRTVTFEIVDEPTLTQTIIFPSIPDLPLGTPNFAVSTSSSAGMPSLASDTPGVCSIGAGNSVTLLSLGTCSLTAARGGNNIYFAATPVTRTFQVTPPDSSYPQTIQVPGIPFPMGLGPLLLDYRATSGLPVIFASENRLVCWSPSPTLVFVETPGTCVATLTQPGNQVFAPAPPVVISFPVIAPTPNHTISIDHIPNKTLGDPSFPVIATASSGLPVSYSTINTTVCRLSGNMVTLLGAGICGITVRREGNLFLLSASASVSFTVSPIPLAPPTIKSVVNSASYRPGTLAPSSLGVITGTSFFTSPTVTLRDASGVEHTLEQLSTEDPQIDILPPANVALGPAIIKIANSNGSAEMPVTIAATSPGLFSVLGTGQGAAKARIEVVDEGMTSDFSVGDRALIIPAGGDVFITLEATGVRGHALNGVAGRIAGIPVQVLSAGAHTSTPGLDLVKLSVPRAAIEQGTVEIQITVDGVDSNTVTASFGEPRSRNVRRR